LLKQLYIHYLNVVPVIGELQTIDISYLSLIIFFKSISNILIEFLLSDKQVDYAVVCNGIYKSEAANILLDNVGSPNSPNSSNDSSISPDNAARSSAPSPEDNSLVNSIDNLKEREVRFKNDNKALTGSKSSNLYKRAVLLEESIQSLSKSGKLGTDSVSLKNETENLRQGLVQLEEEFARLSSELINLNSGLEANGLKKNKAYFESYIL